MQGKAHKTSKQKHLQGTVYDRSIKIAEYIIENNDTVRGAAKIFGISKSTVHKDLITRLPEVDLALYKRVRKVL
ncbi:MAG: sporulation transcriptional regulator SpoIIID, partial [Clostridia bacterium]